MSHSISSPIVVYDGVCLLCSRWIRFLLEHDREGRYRFAAMQSDSGRQLLISHGLDPDSPFSMLLVENDQGYTDATAIARVLRTLPQRRWHWLSATILAFPQKIRDVAYRFVARHRYRFFGRSDQCFVPTPEQRSRFMP
ncbi:thiol-disulfide oxidoreductase DCC family protein [Dyella caseinilytica]|uniref:Thiol-disulfide oxidoreductase DCC family protein n=1 Tax=Dyella caseinilytica TaxID=1849581 RepID=A0ABX7GXU7_9GAMM|nr:thiol-disulfide oxidoreductase DCC family protein [Dyella caseinilytica]QRN54020.1 thiol-disulfide oxidoreductase DCC family protein [Dyella caseinilytica]GFZ90942.1 membrane protein [Dyella caseinilytica]